MKKILAGLIAAFLMAAGFAAFSSSTASATTSPYPGTVPTWTHVNAPSVRRHHSTTVHVRVGAGNATPKGTVTVVVRRMHGGFSWSSSRRYTGGTISFTTPHLNKRGRYVAVAHFSPRPGSVYMRSNGRDYFRVF